MMERVTGIEPASRAWEAQAVIRVSVPKRHEVLSGTQWDNGVGVGFGGTQLGDVLNEVSPRGGMLAVPCVTDCLPVAPAASPACGRCTG
jgi:hypothetical protein